MLLRQAILPARLNKAGDNMAIVTNTPYLGLAGFSLFTLFRQ
ncbi:hypothetical protein ROV36_04850 [Pasteurella multocida]|nr:hypothetical protein [Pasteurella multocida]MEB3451604.1 hypothetical protein [Pasteurella multocida]MEB3452774.1 hypothetical protein [Pasteurella multocida]MEB3454990.1 hypothetical protein [Pasteurella multocida]MEB3459896.1 hypothetical protein [Pasteurella multocida]MEB3461539.1 hypothetical protein [Pasteurella multocida]